jgi:Pentapeptide repeats (8 copies)
MYKLLSQARVRLLNAKRFASSTADRLERAVIAHKFGMVVLIVVAFALMLWKVPQYEIANLDHESGVTAVDVFNAENRARVTLAQILGGAFLLVGLGFTWWRIEVARQGQLTERLSRAVEQLASHDAAVRIGAIYALERIASESDRDRTAIIGLLIAYVRQYAPMSSLVISGPEQSGRPRLDVQAAMTLLGKKVRRRDSDDSVRLDLSGLDLSNMNLAGAQLPGVLLSGSNLRGACLREANLEWAVLIDANLEMADLTGACLCGADLESVVAEHADFSEADLECAELSHARLNGVDFEHANITDAKFYQTQIKGADLRLVNGIPLPFFTFDVDSRTQLPESVKSWVRDWGEPK